MAAPTGKKERSLLTIDCQGSGITTGIGFAIAIEYTDTDRPWGTLSYRPEGGRISKDEEWRWSKVLATTHEIGDSVFDPVHGDAKARELAERLKALNAGFPWQIGSFNGVPAIQIDAVDGRRIDIDIDDTGIRISRSKSQPPSKGINMHGGGGYRSHAKKPYEFEGRIVLNTGRMPKPKH